MKEIAIISGKGGTGKTSITAALASLAGNPVLVDCDVDAADLHLILSPDVLEKNPFVESNVAYIENDICIQCGMCKEKCRFEAITGDFVVDKISCEGCGVCIKICPVNAIRFEPRESGTWYLSRTRFGTMLHARLNPGEGNSGRLVAILRNRAREIARAESCEYILIDGPPGIGCPVISSITGVDAVLIIAEPTQSSIHDLERVSQLATYFGIRKFVCINRCDINDNLVETMKNRCTDLGADVIATIPYDINFTRAQIEAKTILEHDSKSTVSSMITGLWNDLQDKLDSICHHK